MRLFTLLLVLWSVSGCTQTLHNSDSLCLEMLTHQLDTAGVDIDSFIIHLENEMITGQYFKNHASANYIDVLNKIKDNPDTEFGRWGISDKDVQNLRTLNVKYDSLKPDIIENALTDSNSYLYKRDQIYNEISALQDIDVGLITGCLLRYWTIEDFNSNLYRLTFFKLIYGLYNPHEGITVKLPEYPETVIDTNNQHLIVFEIMIDSVNHVFANGRKIKNSQITDEIKKFLSNSIVTEGNRVQPTSKIVSLKNYRGTSINQYVTVYNEIIRAYNEVRNEQSIEKYGKPFKELDTSIQKEIRNLIPMRISEAEPVEY